MATWARAVGVELGGSIIDGREIPHEDRVDSVALADGVLEVIEVDPGVERSALAGIEGEEREHVGLGVDARDAGAQAGEDVLAHANGGRGSRPGEVSEIAGSERTMSAGVRVVARLRASASGALR